MAVLKSSELKYSTVLKASVGGYWFTATRIEIPTGKEVKAGTLELSMAKLRTGGVGLTDESILGIGPAGSASSPQGVIGLAGEIASTTSVPLAAWCDPITEEAAVGAEESAGEGVEMKEGFFAKVSVIGTPPGKKVFLRLMCVETAAAGGSVIEIKTATKKELGKAQALTVYAFGR